MTVMTGFRTPTIMAVMLFPTPRPRWRAREIDESLT